MFFNKADWDVHGKRGAKFHSSNCGWRGERNGFPAGRRIQTAARGGDGLSRLWEKPSSPPVPRLIRKDSKGEGFQPPTCTRRDAAFDAIAAVTQLRSRAHGGMVMLGFGSRQVVSRLQVHPESRIDVEISAEANGRVRRHIPASADDVADPVPRHADGLRKGARGQ